MIIKPYYQIRDKIRNGDLIAWSGTLKRPLERLFTIGIKLFTGPVTHCSTAVWSTVGKNKVLLLGETMPQGMVFDSLDRRIARAAVEGWTHCWWFPLSKERRDLLDEDAMLDYLVGKVREGTPYDAEQAVKSAFRFWTNEPDDSRLFCSEEHMFALSRGGAVRDCNPSEAHPVNVIQFDIHADPYYQIWYSKKPMKLLNVGTVNPDDWNE